MEFETMQQMSDEEMQITGGFPWAAVGGAIAGGIEVANFLYDVYQGWSSYEPSTPYVYSTITYY